MRIHSITIDNFRSIEHLELPDLPDTGVVVIHGDNEQGKSSILEAVGIVLNVKHSSSKQGIKAVQPVDRDVPVKIRLEFTVGPHRMIITKTYLKARGAELQVLTPRAENHTGAEAEDRLAEILESHLDRTLVDALFMKQGEVDAGISAVGIPTLTTALDGRDRAAGDSREDTALMAAVEAEYGKYFTSTGRRNRRLEAMVEAVDELRTEVDTAHADVVLLKSWVDQVARLEQDRENAERKLPGAEQELTRRRQELDAALKVKARAEEIGARLEQARSDRDQAEKDQRGREDLRRRAAEAQQALEEALEQQEPARDAAAEEAEATARLSGSLENARSEAAAALAEVHRARTRESEVRAQTRAVELDERLKSVDELETRILELRTRQAAHPAVSAEDVEELQQATNEVKVQRALADSRAGSVTFSADTDTEITVDGAALSVGMSGRRVELDRELKITVAGVELLINPGAQITESRSELAAAEAKLAELLERCTVADIGELRERLRTQETLGTEIAEANRDRDRILDGGDAATLRAELAALGERANPVAPGEELSPEDARAALDAAENRREQADKAVKVADAALEGLRGQPADRAFTNLSTRIEILQDAARVAASDVERELLIISDEDLATLVAARGEQVIALEAESGQAQRELAESDPHQAEELCTGAETKVRYYTETISDAKVELASLGSHIGSATGAAERHEKARAALEAADNRLHSELRRAEAARRLRDVMLRHRDEARRRYAAPFADKLSRLAARVFGADTDLNLGGDLSVSSRSIGNRTVDLEHLSGGAREQLAILIRFAIAGLVADSSTHGHVPVFIDDALGSTDPERLAKISTLFSEAGQDSQVFVLTCVPERYNYVTAASRHSIESLKSVLS